MDLGVGEDIAHLHRPDTSPGSYVEDSFGIVEVVLACAQLALKAEPEDVMGDIESILFRFIVG